MNSPRRPWWQQATALVSLSAGGAVTGFAFVPGTPDHVASPAGIPVTLTALDHSARPAASDDSAARAAIVSVTNYYLRMAQSKTPAEMEALIWQRDSKDGADHGESCAAFASMTLALAAQLVGRQSWVTGGGTYPWPLQDWADVRVDPNPASPGIISILQDAQAHQRWHPLGDGYQPLPGDWVLIRRPRGGRDELLRRRPVHGGRRLAAELLGQWPRIPGSGGRPGRGRVRQQRKSPGRERLGDGKLTGTGISRFRHVGTGTGPLGPIAGGGEQLGRSGDPAGC